MTRKSTLEVSWIAPGIPVVTLRTESYIEAYRRIQAECAHEKRDPNGQCYRCGDRKEAPHA